MNSGYQGYSAGGGNFGNNAGYGGGSNFNNYGGSQGAGYGGAGTAAGNDMGGASGGGFVPYSGSQDVSKQDSRFTLIPANIMQVLDAPVAGADDTFLIDGVEARNVVIVARVNNITTQTTKTVYQLEDGTGMIEAIHWLDNSGPLSEVDRQNAASEEKYVRVAGRIKESANKRHINTNILKPITDMNEVFTHINEVIYQHWFATRGPLASASTAPTNQPGQTQPYQQKQQQQQLPQQHQQSGPNTNNNLQNIPLNARRVMGVIRKHNSQTGVHYRTIAQELNLSEAEIRQAGEQLTDAGLIFTPEDDDTWAELVM